MKKKVLIGLAASVCLAFGAGSFAAGASEFSKVQSYKSGMFTDVAEDAWYASSVSNAYELGFMKGTAENAFSPEGNMTAAEAVTIAARVHDAYFAKHTSFSQDGAHWYDDYVSYATENGILEPALFDDYDRPATRSEMALLFSGAVPASYLTAQNAVEEIPDVPETNRYYNQLLTLYKAGILMGNDEFGTFLPNNNISRAEAAAIIGRIALPATRLQKTLTDANFGDAYYLIRDMKSTFRTGDAGSAVLSPWFIDKRFAESAGGEGLSDFNPSEKVEVWRDIDDVSRGLLGLDFIADIQFGKSGLYFRVTDDGKTPLLSLDTKESKFFLNGTDTGVAVKDGMYYVNVRMDLDNHTAELFINGEKIDKAFTLPNVTAARFYIGSDEEGMAYVVMKRCDLYKDYLVNERFLVPENTPLCGWEVTGDAQVVRAGGEINNDVNSARLSAGAAAKKTFRKISGKVVFESFMLFPTAADTGFVSLSNGETEVAKLIVNADGIFKADGTKLRHHVNNIWQTLRIEADTVTGKVLYKINGKKVGEYAFDAAASTVDTITFGATGGSVIFDDAVVFLTHEYDDYCPTPKPVGDDDYDTLLNVCNLWHDGTGWGAVSAYPDIEPALGYYDEGIPETADWQIKFMVENGIDVQHMCWYSPSTDIKEPIKKPQINYWALHEGYFNAKYSDLMKFAIMWENNADVYGLEQFKEFVWPYWVEYYFTDSRYYTIDNQIVFTVWSYPNFRKAFGDSDEGAKAAIAFMNEDIQKYGFDGVKVIFFDCHKKDAATFQTMANMGAAASYAYHWQQDGNKYETTIARLENNAANGALHIIPTVSVGFNNIGWSNVRKPLISLEDHKKVLEYIKNDYLPRFDGWKAKTLVVSTWNEYGEGTYVMPCAGLHGFGYLENVAEVLAGKTDHTDNIYPTDAQKARLGHMYPKTKTSLKRYDIEQPEQIVSDKVLYTATGEDLTGFMHLTDTSMAFDGIFKGVCETGDPAVRIKDEKLFAPIAASEIANLRIKMRVSVDSLCDIFFLTADDQSYSESKSFRFDVKAGTDMVEYVVETATCENWKGDITAFRIDPITGAGEFDIASFELLGVDEEKLPYTLTVDGKAYTPVFPIEARNDDFYAAAEAYSEFFARHHFYFEWDRHTGRLYIASAGNKEITFTVGSDKALANGKEIVLKEAVSLKDGLPVLPLEVLYDALGVSYEITGKTIAVTLKKSDFDKKNEEIRASRVPGSYEFAITGDAEGWTGANTSAAVADGVLSGASLKNSQGWYDPLLLSPTLSLDAAVYNKIVIGIKHDSARETGETLQVFFITDSDKAWNGDKCFTVPYESSSSGGKFIEYAISCTQNAAWNGTVTGIRVDPLSASGTYAIDYIRIIEDTDLKAQKEKELAEKLARGFELVGGDAEDPENAAFFNKPSDSVITIVRDEEKNSNVYQNMAITGYNYARQSVVWTPGKTYEVSVDFKVLSNRAGKTDFSTQIFFNARFTDADGKYDHPQKIGELAPDDGWQTLKFSFEIPDGIDYHDNDEFSFYVNPADNQGVNYLFDNVTVTVK